jgi:hypothetical protein
MFWQVGEKPDAGKASVQQSAFCKKSPVIHRIHAIGLQHERHQRREKNALSRKPGVEPRIARMNTDRAFSI